MSWISCCEQLRRWHYVSAPLGSAYDLWLLKGNKRGAQQTQ
jgi:hypothetical protein